MKGKLFLVFAVMLLFGFSSFSCYAQSASNDQRIVGTWVGPDNHQLVFNANGSGSWSGGGETGTFTFGISLTGQITFIESGQNRGHTIILYFSPDGRTMIWQDSIFRKR